MKKLTSIDDVANILGDGGPFCPDVKFETIEEMVDALVSLGNTGKVFVCHDAHLGLKERLSEDFLESPLGDIDKQEFEIDIESVLEQANVIIPLSNRELSEDDLAAIRDDKRYRGEDPDD